MRIVSNTGTDRIFDLIQPWIRPGYYIARQVDMNLELQHLRNDHDAIQTINQGTL